MPSASSVNLEHINDELRAELYLVSRDVSYEAQVMLDESNRTCYGTAKMNQSLNTHLAAGGMNLFRLTGSFTLDPSGNILAQVQSIYKSFTMTAEYTATFYIADDNDGINFTAAAGEEDLASALAAYASPFVVAVTAANGRTYWSIDFVGSSNLENQPILHQHGKNDNREHFNLILVPFYGATAHYVANMTHWGKQNDSVNGTLLTKAIRKVISELDAAKDRELTSTLQGLYRRLNPPRGSGGKRLTHHHTYQLMATNLETADYIRQQIGAVNEGLSAQIGCRAALLESDAAGVWHYTNQIAENFNTEPPRGFENFFLEGRAPIQLPAVRRLLTEVLGKEALVLRDGKSSKFVPLLLQHDDARKLAPALQNMVPPEYTLTRKAQARGVSSDPYGLKLLNNTQGPSQKKATLQRHHPPQRLPPLSVDAKP